MSFEEFYAHRMEALACDEAGDNPFQLHPFKPSMTIPLSVPSPYYKDREIWRHYPNMYDFRRAAIFNVPPAVLYPYNNPSLQPDKLPEYLASQDFRKRASITKNAMMEFSGQDKHSSVTIKNRNREKRFNTVS